MPLEPLSSVPAKLDVPEPTLIVRVAAVALPLSTVPEPVSPATVGELPLSRSTAPSATLTALDPAAFRAPVLDSCSTPPLTLRPPVNVLLPPRISVPVEVLLRAELPLTVPLRVTAPTVVLMPPTWIVRSPVRVG